MDPHKILGIEKDASPDEIRRAYRKQALKYHPDKGGDVWVFQQIQNAYDELTGKKKKKKPKAQSQSPRPTQPPQPEPTKPFTEKPFGDEPFEFKFEKEEPRPRYEHWQAHTPKSKGPFNRRPFRLSRWQTRVGAVAIPFVLIALTVVILRSRGMESGESSAKENPPTDINRAAPAPIVAHQPQRVNESAVQDDAIANVSQSISESPPILLPNPVLSISFDEPRQSQISMEMAFANKAQGIAGDGLEFTNKSYAKLSKALPVGSSPRSVALWIKARDTLTYQNYHVMTYGEHRSTASFGIMIGQKTWRFYDGFAAIDTRVSVDTDWHHHCLTFDGKDLIYYFDGEPVLRRWEKLDTGGGSLFLGIRDQTYSPGFDGFIDEFAIFSEPLSSDQAKVLHTLGREGKHWSDFATVKLVQTNEKGVRKLLASQNPTRLVIDESTPNPRVPLDEKDFSFKCGTYSVKVTRFGVKSEPEEIAIKFYDNGEVRWNWRITGTWKIVSGQLHIDLPGQQVRVEPAQLLPNGFQGRFWDEKGLQFTYLGTLDE